MRFQALAFGFAAVAFAIRAIRQESSSVLSWVAAAAFGILSLLCVIRAVKS